MPWYYVYGEYESWYDWNYWHDMDNRRKKLNSESRRKEWNNKTKLPRITKTRRGCWL